MLKSPSAIGAAMVGCSTFEHMTEEEIAAGMAALDAAVARETSPHPIETTSDLLVLG